MFASLLPIDRKPPASSGTQPAAGRRTCPNFSRVLGNQPVVEERRNPGRDSGAHGTQPVAGVNNQPPPQEGPGDSHGQFDFQITVDEEGEANGGGDS